MAGGVAKRLAPRMALLAAGIAVGLGLAEAGLRLIGFEAPLYPETIEFGFPDPETRASLYEPDPDLFWTGPSYTERLSRAEGVGMVFLGDSCTEFGKYDVELARLAARDQEGRALDFLNAGCGGWTSWQGRQQMARDVAGLRPAVATIYFGWNDHWVGFGLEDKEVARLNETLLYPLRDVRLVQLGRLAWIGLAGDEGQPLRVAPEDFRSNIAAMIETAREAGIEPILLTAPSSHAEGREPAHLANRWIPDLEELVPRHRLYADMVREVAIEKNAILCDLAAEFEEIPRSERARRYFKTDGIHLTEEGDRLAAEMLMDCLEREELLEKVLAPEEEARQMAGRDFPGATDDPPERPVAEGEPLVVKVTNHRFGDSGAPLVIEGWVRSPKIVDDVVVYCGEKNLGAAIYPLACEEDRAAGFYYRRELENAQLSFRGEPWRIAIYSGDELVGEKEAELE